MKKNKLFLLDAKKMTNHESPGVDIWLDPMIKKSPARSDAIYAVTGHIENTIGFPCGPKRGHLLISHLADCHYRESNYWGNNHPAYIATTLNEKNYSIKRNKGDLISLKREYRNAFFSLIELKDTIDKLENHGLIIVIGGADKRSTRISPSRKLKELFDNPPEVNHSYKTNDLIKDVYVPLIIKDKNKKLSASVSGKARDIERMRSIMLKSFETIWNSKSKLTLEISEELISMTTDSEIDHIVRILNDATVEWSSIEEGTSDKDEEEGNSIPIGNGFSPFYDLEDTILFSDYAGLRSLGLAHPKMTPGSYNITKFLIPKIVLNNSSHTEGGRVYCTAQNIPKSFRSGFRIDGEELVCLDIVSSHPRMLYHMEGIEAPADVYACLDSSYERSDIKRIINGCINDNKEWKNPVVREFKKNCPEISKYLGTGIGVKLQAYEGKIARSLMEKWMNRKGRLFIPMHDGYYIQKDMVDEFRSDIEKFYSKIKELNGFKPLIEEK